MGWIDGLKKYKKLSGKTYKEISAETGITCTSLEKLFNGQRDDIKLNTVIKLAQCFDCTVGDIVGKLPEGKLLSGMNSGESRILSYYRSLDSDGKRMAEDFLKREAQRAAKLKDYEKQYTMLYYDFPVSAGTGEFLDDSTAAIMKLTAEPPSGADYILRVSGDSMEPDFSDGDLVFVHRSETVEYGDIGIFVYGGSVYMKQYTKEGLRSLNPAYGIIKGCGDISCLGKVLGVVACDVERQG